MANTINFPDPLQADNDGLVAIGGELTPDYIISAYSKGIFPWFSEGDEILWWSPNPRLVLFPNDFKLKKSLKQVIRGKKFTLKIDHDFRQVIHNCSRVSRPNQDGTWITGKMINAYCHLHRLGIGHSFEIYNQSEKLVGGLYGLSLGRAFFGESMFFFERDASKVALYYLVEWCKKNDFHFIDAQQSTPHLISLGAVEISRNDFINRLERALDRKSIQGKWG